MQDVKKQSKTHQKLKTKPLNISTIPCCLTYNNNFQLFLLKKRTVQIKLKLSILLLKLSISDIWTMLQRKTTELEYFISKRPQS